MQRRRVTLAINFGTRYLGIAVLRGSILADWAVKNVSGQYSEAKQQKLERLVFRLINGHNPDVLVLKKLHPSLVSGNLCCLNGQIEKFADANHIPLKQYSIRDMEAFYSSDSRINKGKLAEFVCRNHPVLRRDLDRERNILNPYHIRMFEAVALATLAAAEPVHNLN